MARTTVTTVVLFLAMQACEPPLPAERGGAHAALVTRLPTGDPALDFASVSPSVAVPVAVELVAGLEVPPARYFALYAKVYGLGATDTMELFSADAPAAAYGLRRERYRQKHDGLPVFGAEVALTIKDERVLSAFGHVVAGLTTPRFTVDARAASAAAVRAVQVELRTPGRPVPTDLVVSTPVAGWLADVGSAAWQREGVVPAAFRPGYVMGVSSAEQSLQAAVRIAADDGSALLVDLGERTNWGPKGMTGTTAYDGVKGFQGETSDTGQYRLHAQTPPVLTFNGLGNDFTPTDVYPDYLSPSGTVAPDPKLDRGVQAHWALSTGAAFFQKAIGWNGYDNAGDPLRLLVDINNVAANNGFCFFAKAQKRIVCSEKWPTPSIDVLSHEYGHSIVAHTAEMLYQAESGALDESFSDIFGVSSSFANASAPSWVIGTQCGKPLRDMEHPHSLMQPSAFQGTYWVSGATDHGGVHTNAVVQDKWFSLLAEGGAGFVNDVPGNAYSIQKLGREGALQIAFFSLLKLGPNATFWDAQMSSRQAARQLCGEGSNEEVQTRNAWYAVGIGSAGTLDGEVISPVVNATDVDPWPVQRRDGARRHAGQRAASRGPGEPRARHHVLLANSRRWRGRTDAALGVAFLELLAPHAVVQDRVGDAQAHQPADAWHRQGPAGSPMVNRIQIHRGARSDCVQRAGGSQYRPDVQQPHRRLDVQHLGRPKTQSSQYAHRQPVVVAGASHWPDKPWKWQAPGDCLQRQRVFPHQHSVDDPHRAARGWHVPLARHLRVAAGGRR
jgi:Thermolysin metallopeptidase, alpha-helical domain/Fungalysin/Thermolysin Propeptide Motif/Thermolysin metallopeptidase, catalytic domain